MKKLAAVLSVIFLFFIVHGYAGASILTFDDITVENAAGIDAYGGLTWTNTSVIHKDSQVLGTSYPGFQNGAVSGDYVAINNYEQMPGVSFDSGQFDFNGVYLTAASNDGLNITVVGELNGVEIYSQDITVDTSSPTWFDFSFSGIDALVFLPQQYTGVCVIPDHPGGYQFAMDNFTFNELVHVPIPSTIWFLGSGFLGLAGYRTRFKEK